MSNINSYLQYSNLTINGVKLTEEDMNAINNTVTKVDSFRKEDVIGVRAE